MWQIRGGEDNKVGLWRKVLVFFGFDDVDDSTEGNRRDMFHRDSKEDKVVNINRHRNSIQILVLDPVSFEEVRKVVDYLKDNRPIILNLDKTDKEQAKRIIDFVSGATYSLQGNMQKIGDGIFLFTPKDVEISGQDINTNEFWKESWKKDQE